MLFLCFLTAVLPVSTARAQTSVNNNISGAIELEGNFGTTTGSIQTGDNREGGPMPPVEPNHAGVGGNKSVWYYWRAPFTGSVTFTTHSSGTTFNSVLAVYVSSAVPASVPYFPPNGPLTATVASNDDVVATGPAPGSYVRFNATVGVNYFIAVDINTLDASSPRNFTLSWGPTPSNDDFATPQNLGSAGSGFVQGTNTLYSFEANEPSNGNVTTPRHSAWYLWTAPANGPVTFSTDAGSALTTFNTTLAVFTGVDFTSPLAVVDQDDNTGLNNSSVVNFNATAGTQYRIVVDGANNSTGLFAMYWSQGTAATPNNDNFANAQLLTGAGGTRFSNNFNSTVEAGEPAHAGLAPATTVWYRWLAPSSGKVVFSTFTPSAETTFDTVLAVYQGTTLSGLRTIVSNNDYAAQLSPQSFLEFEATAGQLYYIAVGGRTSSSTGFFRLNYSLGGYAGTFGFTQSVYEANENEGTAAANSNMRPHDIPGARITITRRDGYSGRMIVKYRVLDTATATNGLHYSFPATDPTSEDTAGGFAFRTYTNSVIFDDWQTSASFLVVPANNGSPSGQDFNQGVDPTVGFAIVSVTPAPGESPLIIPPSVDVFRNTSRLEIYDDDTLANIEKVHLQVSESQTQATVRVFRRTNPAGNATRYQINGNHHTYRNSPNNAAAPANNAFSLSAGSDYAKPSTPNTIPDIDFTTTAGVIDWQAVGVQTDINIPLNNDLLVEFNEDFRFDLWNNTAGGEARTWGQTDHCYVTIVTDDSITAEQAAGAVDPSYNRDYFNLTTPPFNPTPGANDMVHAVAVDSNQQAIVGGDFTAVNSDTRFPRLARMTAAGVVDPAFNVGTGPNSSVLAIKTSGTSVFIAGKFTSYNSIQRKGVAKILPSGAIDGSFNPQAAVADPFATPIRAIDAYPAGTNTDSGKLIVAGDFTEFNGEQLNRIARLNANGTLDTASFNPNGGANGPIYAVKIITGINPALEGKILVGGDFTTFGGLPRRGIVRLNSNGSVDVNFNPGNGADGIVYAVDYTADGGVIIGGAFGTVDLRSRSRVARFTSTGALDQNFDIGSGADDTVYSVVVEPVSDRILLGGLFRSFNQVRRAGMARLLPNGYLDTEFMEIAYNHYAGLHMRFSPYAEAKPFVRSMALQADGNIMIGGSFQRVGGGNRNTVAETQSPTPSLLSPWRAIRAGVEVPIVTPTWIHRDDVRNRYNFARVMGGNTPGPGNIGFTQTNYAADEKGGQFFITLSRENTAPNALSEGFVSFSTFDLAPGPGVAVGGSDYGTTNSLPRWQNTWPGSAIVRMVSESQTGPNNNVLQATRVYVGIVDDAAIEGDESFQVQLTNPKPDLLLGGTIGGRSPFYWSSSGILEGENIPIGVALGRTTALVDVIDDDFEPSFIAFKQTKYSVTENGTQAVIEVVRSGSTARSISVDYLATEHLGAASPAPYFEYEQAASAGLDFTGVSGRLTFGPGQTSATFTVPIFNDVTAEGDESINLYLLNISQGSSFATSAQTLDNTVDTGTETLTAIAHGLYNDSLVRFSTSGGALPGGLSPNIDYYVIVKTRDTFQVSTSPGGTPVNLTSNGNNAQVNTILSLARLDIYDNDFSAGAFRFSTTTRYTTSENGGSVVVTVERTGGNVGQVAVDFRTLNNTAIAGMDYVTNFTTLTWNSLDSTPKTITLTILDDSAADGVDKSFLLQLSNARRLSGSGVAPQLAGVNPVPVLIQENDRFGVIGFALNQFNVSEGGGKALITVTRSNGVAGQQAVTYTTVPSGTARPVYRMDASLATSVNAAGNRLLITRHGLANGTLVRFTSGTPPDGTLVNEDYLVANATTDDFQLLDADTGVILDIGLAATSDTAQLNAYYAFDAKNAAVVVDAADEIVYPGHPFQNGDQIEFSTVIVNGLPVGVNSGQTYYVVGRDNNSFQVSFIPNGSPVSIAPSTAVTVSGTAYTVIHVNDHYYVHTTGTLLLDPLVTSTNFTVDLVDNLVQNPNINSTFNRTVVLQLTDSGDAGGIDASILRIVDDENINEPAGAVDTTYNSDAGPDGFVYAMALLSDERLIIGGDFTSVNGLASGRLARLKTDGNLDSGFNVGTGANDSIRSIIIQDDSRMLISGLFTDYNGLSRAHVARVNIDGTLDTSFDPGSGANNPIYALGLVRSGSLKGKVIVGGSFSTMGGFARPYVARLDTNGVVDQTFNTGSGPNGTVFATLVQDDGKVIIGGDFTTVNLKPAPYLARLNTDGSLDTNFTANINFNASVRSLALQSDGKMVVGGYFTVTNLLGETNRYITRINTDGSNDFSFNPEGGGDAPVLALALQLDGKILVGGDFQKFSNVTRRRLTRLNPDGTKDVNINFGTGANNFVSALQVQPSDGRLIVGGGFTRFNDEDKNYLARIYGGVLGGRGALEFAVAAMTISESQTNTLVTVRRTGGTEGTVRANYYSRTGTATEDIDYLALSVTNVVEFAPGETEKQISVVLLPDSLPEGLETLDLVLSALDPMDPFYAPLGNQPETTLSIADNDSEIAFGQLQMSVSESDATGQLLVPIIRSFALDGTVTIRLVSSNFTATAGTDFVGINQLVTFQPGETIKNVAVNILPDIIEEGNEIFYLRLEKNPLDPDGRISTTAFETEITIIDDDFFPGTIQFSSALFNVDENAGFAFLTVVRTNGSSGLVTVNYTTGDVNDAVGGSSTNPPNDFLHTNGSIAFADGEIIKTIRVPILPDSNTQETNEIFQVTLSGATGGASLGFPNPTTVSIANNNSAVFGTFVLQINPTINEGDPALLVSVLLNNRITNATVMVDYDTLPGTAGTNDFTPTTGQLTFVDGVSSNGFLVPILNDGLVESNEVFQIVLRNAQPSGGPSIGTLSSNVTIVSTNMLAGTVVFTQAQYTADEGAGVLQVVLARTNGYTGLIAVDITLSDLQAKGYISGSPVGFDYTNTTTVTPIIVTWNDGDIDDKTVNIPLINDSVVEADEGFRIVLSNPINAILSDVTNALGFILDDELKSGAVDPVFTASANGPVLSLSIRPGASLGDITLGGDFTRLDALARTNVAQVSIDGTAYTGFDAGSITLGGTGAVVRAVSVYTNGNDVGKVLIVGRFDSINGVPRNNIARLNNDGSLDTTFDPGLGANAPINALVVQADGRILIAGDFNRYDTSDRNFVARILSTGAIDPAFDPVAGANGPVNALALQSDGRIVVGGDFSKFNGSDSPRLARLLTSGAMDTAFSTALGSGFDGAVFALAMQSDERILVGGAFTVFNGGSAPRLARLNSNGTADTVGFTGIGTGFNDSVFAITLQNDRKILVGGNFTSFQGVPQNRIIRLTATGARDTTMNFGSGADSFVSSMVIQPDGKVVIGGGFQTFDGQVRPYIARVNNGTNTGAGVLQFSATDFPVYENGGSVTLTVKRILGLENSLSVEVAFIDGTAYQGTNYLLPSIRTLDFAEGEAVKTLVVNIPDDPEGAVVNPVRQFTVRLINATNHVTHATADIVSSRDSATVSIIDNETVIGFQTSSFVVAENGLNAVINLVRTGGSNDPVTLTFETALGTATEVLDYLAVTNTVVWLANDMTPKTILIPVVEDALVEGIETVNLQISGYGGPVLAGLTNAVLSILDNDFSSGIIAFESAAYRTIEGQTAQISVVRTNGSSGIVSAMLTVSNATALAGSDYLTTNILVTFANGESRKVVEINTKDDALQDDGEHFLIHLGNASGGAVLGLSDATVFIDDNDVTIGFTQAALNVTESDTTLSLTVTRSGLDARTFIVDYTTANISAQAGLDYVQTNGVVVFGPNEYSKVLEVQVKDDYIIEGPESFRVLLSGTNLSLLGFTQTTINIDDNDLATDLEVLVKVNNPVKTNTTVRYSLLVTNYGPSDISGVTLTNILPASLQLSSISVTNVTTNGNALIFDLPVLPKASGYLVEIEALDTNGIIRSVTNIAAIGLPALTNDLDLANNTVTNVTGLRGPGPYLAIESLSITSETPGPANGAFDLNEQVSVNVTFRNLGDVASTAAAVSLAGTGGVVTNVGPQNATLGSLAPNASAVRSFTFNSTGTNGGLLTLTFNLTDTGGINYDPGILRYRLGSSVLTGSTNQIVINAMGPATPYPDQVVVSGMVGILDKISLTLSNLSHDFPADIDMLLVSPMGQGVIVMSDAGQGFRLTNVTFSISDQATLVLPQSARITNGFSYRPADYDVSGDLDDFGPLAPAGPHFSTLSAFRGIDPNGVWRLYVYDDTTGDAGVISNGWSLNITTVFPANPSANLIVTGTQTAGPLLVGADQTYTLLVTNRGPATVNSVMLTNTFSSGFTFITASNTVNGTVTLPSSRVVLNLGTMTNGQVITNYVTVRPTASGSFTNIAVVGIASTETDPFLGDNALVFAQTVGANADLAVGVTTTPVGTVALGNNLTYSVTLTNLGPSTATGVTLTNVLPAGVNYVSGSASQGVVTRSGSLVTATLGNVAVNATVQLTIVVTPTAAGSLTNTVTAASTVSDSNAVNNVAVTTTTAVTDSADLAISLIGTPNPVTQGNNITYTIALTNRGPSTATGVVITNPVPASVTLQSFTTPQGTVANVGGAVVFTLGSVPTGTNVTMQVIVTANTAGAVNSTAFVTAGGTFDPVTANNSSTITIAVQNPSADIDLGASTLLSESITPVNGAIDPGETVTVSLELVNKGALSTGNLVATLLPTGGVVTNSPQVQTYGAIASGAGVARNFTFTANGNLGDTLSVTLQLQDGASNLGTVTFTFQLGETERVGSATLIAGVDVGPAVTYPSVITVSGVSGTILKATITLSNVSHTFPDDFDLLLVSPTGRKVLLMSDAGGGFAINGVNITLDDSAAASLPDSGTITDGVYKPSNYLNSPVDQASTNDVFAAPAPAGPYAASLADLVGSNPNGQWSLYVVDDQTGNIGSIGGWSLSIVTVSTLTPSADVALTVIRSPEPVTARSNLTYTVTVTNSGPNGVSGVLVSNSLPAGAQVVSLATTQGTIITNGAGAVLWTIGSMPANAQYQAAIVITPDLPGSITNVTTVTHADLELNNANNTVTTISTVQGVALSGGSISVTPGNVSLMLVGQPNVTYIVEATSDFVTWVEVSRQSSPDGIIVINDPAGSSGGLRFYRARQQ